MPALLIAGSAYLLFNAVSLGCLLFLADLWLPQTIDRSIWPLLPWPHAAAIDIGLLVLFGLQHSVMARAGFKARLHRILPPHLERTAYVIASSLALGLLIVAWQPIPAIVWQVRSPVSADLLWAVYAAGWLLVVAATYMINHYELFGLAQVWRKFRGLPAPADDFRTPYLYRYVRHPLYLGWLLVFWATPSMSAGHLLFAAGMSLYILIGMMHEERDLLRLFGAAYRDYRARVPALIPGLKLR
jgi:methanethiol S-methyltransferase